MQALAKPGVRPMMPVPIRPALEVTPANPAATAAFVENDARTAPIEKPPHAGLSPDCAPLDWSKTWGSFAPSRGVAAIGEWRSAPLVVPPRAWLKFETAGQLREPGVALELRDVRTDKLLASIQPTKVPGNSWRSAFVHAPDAPFVIVARDDDATRWLAFGGPTEMGPLSYWASRATRHGQLIMVGAGVGTLLLAAIAMAMNRPRSRA
jgi:hypothetical protein